MKHLVTIPVTFLILLLSVKMSAQHNADSMAILSILQEEVSSWNIGDADTYSKHFSENGTFTNIRGMFFTGHNQFLDRHIEIFKGVFKNSVLQQEVVSFRFLSPDVAIVETLTWVSGFPREASPKGVYVDSNGRFHTRLLQVFQKQSGDWKIVVYHNTDLKPDTPVPAHQ